MAEQKYFIFYRDSGDLCGWQTDRATLLEKMNSGYFGTNPEFVQSFDELGAGCVLIVKGEAVMPKAVKVVEEFEID